MIEEEDSLKESVENDGVIRYSEWVVELETSEDLDDQLSVFSEPLGEEEELFTQEEDSCRVDASVQNDCERWWRRG